MESTKGLWEIRGKIKKLENSDQVTKSREKDELKHQNSAYAWPYFPYFSPLFNCLFYFHVSNAEMTIMCQDPVIGVGEPGRVIQKLCQFSDVPSSPGGPAGGIITYECVGSQWKVKRNNCISAPINSLLQLAKVILRPLPLSSWWGDLSSLYISALRKMALGLICVALKGTFICLFPKKM